MNWTPEQHDLMDTALTVLSTLGAAWLAVRKGIDAMITRKVREQVQTAMSSVTDATSKQIEQLREDVKETHNQNLRAQQAITDRLDTLLTNLALRGGGK